MYIITLLCLYTNATLLIKNCNSLFSRCEYIHPTGFTQTLITFDRKLRFGHMTYQWKANDETYMMQLKKLKKNVTAAATLFV